MQANRVRKKTMKQVAEQHDRLQKANANNKSLTETQRHQRSITITAARIGALTNMAAAAARKGVTYAQPNKLYRMRFGVQDRTGSTPQQRAFLQGAGRGTGKANAFLATANG